MERDPMTNSTVRARLGISEPNKAMAYGKPGRYTIAVKVIDIFGNDTMTLMPVTAG